MGDQPGRKRQWSWTWADLVWSSDTTATWLGPEPMELRPAASQKENVSPRPATPRRPGQRRLPKSLGVVLGSGRGPWAPRGPAERGEPATTPSPRAALRQEPCHVQTNLASPRPRLGLALKDTAGRLVNSRFQQQSNLQPLGALPLRGARASAVQQSNLSAREAAPAGCGSLRSPHPGSEPQESFWPHGVSQGGPQPPGPQAQPPSILKPSWLLAIDAPCPRFRPTLRCASTDGHTQPGPGSWGGLGTWTSRFTGEPLTLDDLAVPTKSPARAPPQAATSRLEPWSSGGQARPAGPQPVLAFWDQRKILPRDLRGAGSPPETPGVQAGLPGSQASSQPASPPQTALEVLAGGFLDPVPGVLPAYPPRRGKRPACSRGQTGDPLLPQEVGSREARLVPQVLQSSLGCPPGQEGGEKAPREQGSGGGREAASYPRASAQPLEPQNKAGNPVNLESERAERARRQLLSRWFGAWQRLVRRRQAVALGGWRLLPGGPQAPRWALRLREARLEVACGRRRSALLAQSFQKWRNLARQQTQGQPHIQAGPGSPPSGGGQPPGPSGRKPVEDPTQRSSPGSLREEAGAQPVPPCSGPRPDGGDGRVQILQALQRLAVFLQEEERARPEEKGQGEASGAALRTQSTGRRPQARRSPAAETAWAPPSVPPHQRAWLRSSFSQAVQRQRLRRILRAWRLRAWGPGHRSAGARTISASGLPGSTPRSPPEETSRAPALPELLLRAAGRRQQARCLRLWRVRARQSRAAARWHRHTLQRRVLLGWSRWSVARGAQRKLAARRAWDRSCRAALGLWRRRLARRQQAERWAREQGRRRMRDALQLWRSSWQRQRCLRDRYQGWAQLRRQGLCRAMFQSWQQAAACQRHRTARPERLTLQRHFQAWRGSARDAGMLRARGRAFQAGLSRRALGAAFATWQEARVAAARVREHRVARACVALWRSHVQGVWADGQLRRARARQAFTAWRVAQDQRRGARQQAEDRARAQTQLALCWALWVQESRLHQLSRAHAARKLSARVLEAWAQSAARGRVQRVTITQFQLVGHRQLLWTQWRTELLSVWLEPQVEAQETSTALPRPRADLAHWQGLAGRGRLLALMDTAAPWKQARSCRPQGPRLPSPAQHRGLGGQRTRRETSGAQSHSAAQLGMQWPGPRAQGPPPPGPGGDCPSEGQGDKSWLGRKYLRRWHLEALLRRLQGSQQARRLAGTWQCWVDAQGAEELARSLLRQWQLRWVWRTWRRRVVQLRVARRLQRRAEGWVLSQAFEKWHRNLAARGLRRDHRQLESLE